MVDLPPSDQFDLVRRSFLDRLSVRDWTFSGVLPISDNRLLDSVTIQEIIDRNSARISLADVIYVYNPHGDVDNDTALILGEIKRDRTEGGRVNKLYCLKPIVGFDRHEIVIVVMSPDELAEELASKPISRVPRPNT
ncbi:hypothetical protein IH981_04000 [Patescibacteria group bacterium]|nr:hypothetical protein [Patescibacteria group bacterium]